MARWPCSCGLAKAPAVVGPRREGLVRDEAHRGVGGGLGDAPELPHHAVDARAVAAHEDHGPDPDEHREGDLRGAGAELRGAGVVLFDGAGGEALRRDQREAEARAQGHLAAVALGRRGERVELLQRAAKVRLGLEEGRPRRGRRPRRAPEFQGLPREARALVVPREELGAAVGEVGVAVEEHAQHRVVLPPPGRARQGLVRRVAKEHVAKGVGALDGGVALHDVGLDEGGEARGAGRRRRRGRGRAGSRRRTRGPPPRRAAPARARGRGGRGGRGGSLAPSRGSRRAGARPGARRGRRSPARGQTPAPSG